MSKHRFSSVKLIFLSFEASFFKIPISLFDTQIPYFLIPIFIEILPRTSCLGTNGALLFRSATSLDVKLNVFDVNGDDLADITCSYSDGIVQIAEGHIMAGATYNGMALGNSGWM